MKSTIPIITQTTAQYTMDKAERVGYFDYTHPADHKEALELTEQLLTDYSNMAQYAEDEKQYIINVLDGDEKRANYLIQNAMIITEDPFFRDRVYRYIRTRAITSRIENALAGIRLEKGYYIIEARYFSNDYYGETPTWQTIAEDLAGQYGFSEKLNEKTVRTQKNKMLDKLAIALFNL